MSIRRFDYFSTASTVHSVKANAIRGGAYTAAAQVIALAVHIGAIPILARLLAPTEFGLVAMVSVFTGLAAMFVDAGLSMATIQRDDLHHQQVSNLFWISASLGLVISLLICAAAPLIAWLYSEPRLIGITIALAPATFLTGIALQHQALLRRAMQLRRVALVQAVGPVVGYVIAILVALQTRSVWALVALPVSISIVRLCGLWLLCPWRPSRYRRRAGVRQLVGFGANLTGFSFVNYFARSADNMLIGWAWGTTALGYYERSYKLMMAPLQQINGPLAGIMVPALSRLKGEPDRYRRAYGRAVAVFQLLSCPVMALIAVLAPAVVDIVLGPSFEPAGPILRWIAIAGFLQPLTNSLGWLYISQGRGSEMMRWGVLGGSMLITSFLIGLPWGAIGVAVAYAGVKTLLVTPLAIWFAGEHGPVDRRDLSRAAGGAIMMALPTVAAALLAGYLFGNGSPVVLVGVATCLAILATLPILMFTHFGRDLRAQIADIVCELRRAGGQRPHAPGARA